MASDVDICNLALSHLGDTATISSINPSEGSAQADHCARFYPIARDTLLELHDWSFSKKRTVLAQVTNTWAMWDYAYAMPSNAIRTLAVIDPAATDDYSLGVSTLPLVMDAYTVQPVTTGYVPQPYVIETDDSGNEVILTNLPNAVLRYTTLVTDTTKFSPLFITTLSWMLASMLAGPLLKGDVGAAEAKRCLSLAQYWLSKAVDSDANQQRVEIQQNVPWMSGR